MYFFLVFIIFLLFIYFNSINELCCINSREYVRLYSKLFSIRDMIYMKQRNNTVFISITTGGYIEHFLDFYNNSNIYDYNEFFVITNDISTYYVLTFDHI